VVMRRARHKIMQRQRAAQNAPSAHP
jgi:hypothetical protein